MELKLAEIGGVPERHHTGIMGSWRQFREDHLSLLGEEELHAPDACSRERLGHFGSNMLRLGQRLVSYFVGLPTLAVVALLLHMADGRTEQCGTVFLGNSEQREL